MKQRDNLAVFKNTKKSDHPDPQQAESWPDYNVLIEMDGKKFEAGLWLRESKGGVKYMSGTIKAAWVKPASSTDEPTDKPTPETKTDNAAYDEDIPF